MHRSEDDIEPPAEIGGRRKIGDVGRGSSSHDMLAARPAPALTLLERGKIEVLAGATLPSLIKLITSHSCRWTGGVKEAIEAGRKYMRAGSADLARKISGDGREALCQGLYSPTSAAARRASAKIVEASARFNAQIMSSKTHRRSMAVPSWD